MKPFALAPRVVAFSLCCAITLPSGVYAEPDRSTLRIEEISETPSTHAELQAGLEENAGELAREWEQGMMRFQERFRALHKGDWWDKLVEYTMAENEPPKAPFTKKQFARLPRPLGKFLLQLLYEVSPVVRDQMSEGNFDSAARNAGEMERIVKHIRMTSGSVGPWLKVGIPEYRDALGELLDFLKEWRDRLDRLASPAGLEETAHPLYWSTPRFVLDGHRRSVSSLVFTPDGKSLVSGGWDGDVVIHWDTATGRSRFTAEGFYGQLGVVALSPDGKTVAFADDLAQRIRLWNTETDRELPLPVGFILRYYTGRIVALTFSPDGVHLASVDDKGTIRLWNLVSGTLQFTLKNDKKWGSLTLAFSPDGKHLVSAVGLGPIQFLDPVTGQVIGALNHPKINHVVPSLAFRPDGTMLAVGSGVGSVDLWEMTTGTSLPNQPHPWHPHGFTSALAFSPDGNTLAIGGPSGSIYLWDINTRHALFVLTGQSGPTRVLTFSPDGKLLASAGEEGPVAVWDIAWIREAAEDRAEGQESLEKLMGLGFLLRKFRTDQTPRAPFAERVKAAQVLHEGGLLIPPEVTEAFNRLPSAGSQQAALLASHLYRVGAFSMEELVDEFENLTNWEALAQRRGGTNNLMGLELHTSIPINSPEGPVIQELLDMTMRVPGNLSDAGDLRIKTIFEDSGLEAQTLTSASPEVGARILELWEKVAEAEGYKWALLPTMLPVEWAWLHVSHDDRLTKHGREVFLYRWVAHNAELAKKTGRSMRPAVSQGHYVAWLVRDPTRSKAKEGSGGRTEVTGEFYFPPERAPNPWTISLHPEVYRQYARDLISDLSDMARAYRAAERNPESWVAATADLPPQTVNSTAHLHYSKANFKRREETLGEFYDSRGVPPANPLDGPQVLRKLAQVLQENREITLVPSELSPTIENDPALVGQIDRFLRNREKLQTVRHTGQAVYPMGWGIDLEVRHNQATLSVPLTGPEPYEAYAGFVDRYLRPKAEGLNPPAILFREDGVYSFNRKSFLWDRINDLWMPDGLGEFLRDRHLALALMVPTNNKEEWWKKLPLFLDPRTLRQQIPPNASTGSAIDPSLMGPLGTPLGSLWGYVGKTMIDPAQPDRIVPLSFIVRPAAGLEEATVEAVGRIDAGILARETPAASGRVIVLTHSAFEKVPGLQRVVEALKEAGLEEHFVVLPDENLSEAGLEDALDRAVIRLLQVKDPFVLAYAAAGDFVMQRFLQKLKPWGILFEPQDPAILKSVTRQILLNLGVPARFLTPANILRFLTSTGLEEAA